MNRSFKVLLAGIFVCSASACTQQKELEQKNAEQEHTETFEPVTQPLKVPLIKRDGTETGFIEVSESASEGLDLRVAAYDLPPGLLAFHIHETGECKKPDFESAGAHFNPSQKEHGFNNPKGHHAGDLPNIEVGADGKVDVVVNAPDVTLDKSSKFSLLDQDGSAFIIHEHQDDDLTNPSGNSGDRMVCGALTNSSRE
ncbi:superoxide dismutase family protein [Bacillus swezeyi]|uniref:Superoxide dismutase family protein n=1 Tax=Bacillus swezeyi TaxID=1925020 RepID=A0A5M8RT47_9BACI|nr:superoxide dismutase family protein [Bacillus swezeyi]KAA6451807.1 superoxide dismutase family protein [Bacillus swezeyi]KAA6482613.1 superoxide dismutase family protein [Bacillus swezeyi]TYS36031.1 superoxide dismutase family protein [Bacillus swezeyi]